MVQAHSGSPIARIDRNVQFRGLYGAPALRVWFDGFLKEAPGFDVASDTPDNYEPFLDTSGARIPYKICLDTDAEQVTTPGGDTSIAEAAGYADKPFWKARVTAWKKWLAADASSSSWSWLKDTSAQGGSGGWGPGSHKGTSSAPPGPPIVDQHSKGPFSMEHRRHMVDSAHADSDPCPVEPWSRRTWSPTDNDNYLAGVKRHISSPASLDKRTYCPYCDMKNHPRWMHKCQDRHTNEHAIHNWHFCVSSQCHLSVSTSPVQWMKREAELGQTCQKIRQV